MNRPERLDLTVLHLGAGRYRPYERDHVTYGIWRELACGFRAYHVIGRSTGAAARWSDENLHVTLIPSHTSREVEFLFSQFRAVAAGRSVEPDVIVCQSPALGGLAAIDIARHVPTRLLMELHGAEFFARARFGSKRWWLQSLTRFALRHADLIRVQTPRMGRQLIDSYGTGLSDRIRVLPPRVNLSHFPARHHALSQGPLRLVTVGAVNGNKGQLRLADALKTAPFAIELHAVGGGTDLERLRRVADELRGEDSTLRIILHGTLPHEQVAAVLRSSDVFVMYSQTEATPRAVMEAMAVGLPVVTTDAGFCADIVEHGHEGFVLGPDPDREIVEVLGRLRDNPDLARRMGLAAAERAHRDYDSKPLFDRYRSLIAEAAAL